jgi:PKD repeat protein
MHFVRRAPLLAAWLCSILTACGGGGGGDGNGSGTPPVNSTPPTATISAITPAQRVANQPVLFSGSGTTTAGGTLTYTWTFGDGGTASGTSVSHNYSTFGTFTVTFRVTDSRGLFTDASQSLTLVAAPATPTIALGAGPSTPQSVLTFTASGTDPQGSALTFAWDFGDGGSANGAAVTHAFASTGDFQIRVIATNALGISSASAFSAVHVAWLPSGRPSLILRNAGHLLGQTLFTNSAFIETNGLPYTMHYDFGDGTSAESTDSNLLLRHDYAAAGIYSVRVTARSAGGEVTSLPGTVTVAVPTALPAVTNNVLEPYCAGAFCGATNATTYSGSGLGVWRYHNSTNVDANVNVSIAGLRAGLAATLVFSNGATSAASAPVAGTSKISRPQDPAAVAHAGIIDANQRFATSLARGSAPPTLNGGARVLAAAPPVGTTRTWRESGFTGLIYNIRVAASCPTSTGRNIVIWTDLDQEQRGELDVSRVGELVATVCGATGAYERLVAMIGDVWGPAASATPALIQDTPTLQDLNVVIPGVPNNQAWNGYFSAGNLTSKNTDPTSNGALAVVINGYVFANYPDTRATRNTLIHEMKHLANFYQRALARGVYHATWLEETSAMLAEDMISPLTTFDSRTDQRVGGYAFSGAGVSLTNWSQPGGQSYNLGGSLGTFLHRRYGASLDSELITMCADDGSPQSSYDCIEQFISRHGGTSFADDFARVGVSTLGMAKASDLPAGFGYPGIVIGGTPLAPIGNFVPESPLNPAPVDLGGTLPPTAHWWSREYIHAGQSTFLRNNVVVPAHTTLLVVIAEPVF